MHADAFSADDTKRKHAGRFKEELDKIDAAGAAFIAGGDLNMLPPASDSTDYCDEDRCPGESFHHPGDDPFHKEGSNYTPEKTWLEPLYAAYQADIPPGLYKANQRQYFTHCTDRSSFGDRKIDYLFTNRQWVAGSVVTHQDFADQSDHIPVSAKWQIPK
jgi:endonuclease/exonuclease/phosphatase family metal-dependent hydrolase